MKESGCGCGCILVGRKFINETGNIDKFKLSVIYERWHKEQLSCGIKERFAFDVIRAYSENICDCDCHKIKTIKEEK